MKAPLAERLREVNILWRRSDSLCLYGLPYLLRPGQEPRHLWEAHERYVPSRTWYYQAPQTSLDSWLWLGSPGWWGTWTKAEQEEISAFLARYRALGEIPDSPGEWSILTL